MGERKPLFIGQIVKPWGRVAAVGMIGGERYYWLVDLRTKAVSMMPADTVEAKR